MVSIAQKVGSSPRPNAVGAPLMPAPYRKQQFLRLTGLNLHTLRNWLHARLLSRPIGRGPGTRYTDLHVEEVRRIREMLKNDRSIHRAKAILLQERAQRSGFAKTPQVEPEEWPPGESWQMLSAMPGVIIGVAASASPETRRVVREMLRLARADERH